MNFMSHITGILNAGESPKEPRGFHFAPMHYRFFGATLGKDGQCVFSDEFVDAVW